MFLINCSFGRKDLSKARCFKSVVPKEVKTVYFLMKLYGDWQQNSWFKKYLKPLNYIIKIHRFLN